MGILAERVTYEYDGREVRVSSTHPSFALGQDRLRIREFVFTRKDDAIFEAALREKYPDMIVLVEHSEPILRFEPVASLLADNQRGQRWIVIPDDSHWVPLVEIVSQPDSPRSRARLRNLPGRWLAYDRSAWMWPWDNLIGRPTSFDWPYLTRGRVAGQLWSLDPDVARIRSFYRTAWRIISRIATDRAKHGTRLMNELNGGDYKRMADLERCRAWMGHCALEWSRAGGDRKMLDSFYRPADDWEVPSDPWYRRLKAEVEARYGVDFGLPPTERPDDGEYSTP